MQRQAIISFIDISFIDAHRNVREVKPICKLIPQALSKYHEHIARRAKPARLLPRA